MRKLQYLIILFALFLNTPLFSTTYDTVLIAGFQNLGDSADDNLNVVLTKSLINWLSMIGEVRVVTYENTAKAATANGFWAADTVDTNLIEMMGLRFSSRKIVFGSYTIDNAKNLITLNYSIYDLRSGQVYYTRKLEGPAGLDVFDTIEEMSRKVTVSVVGREVNFAALSAPPDTRWTPANTYIVPASIVLSAAGGLALYFINQGTYAQYTNDLMIYGTANGNLESLYNTCLADYNTLKLQYGFQIGLYSLSAVLTGLEFYLIARKPQMSDSFAYIALPNYFGVAIRF